MGYVKMKAQATCPAATGNIALNLANRANARKTAGYGPANPGLPNVAYWTRLAAMWGVPVAEAKTMRCGNCAAFNDSESMIECIRKGMGPEGDPEATIKAGHLGYCQFFHFKCAAARTCAAWVSREDEGDQ